MKDDAVSARETHLNVRPGRKTTTAALYEGDGGGVQRTHSGALEQRHVSVMVAVTQKLTGWRDVKGEINQDKVGMSDLFDLRVWFTNQNS